jgi:MarR family transcriptional regulator, transcriptional regulator for hemolysin
MIVHMVRSTATATTTDTSEQTELKAAIIADFRSSMGELKCISSERLLRKGISMAQLHVLYLVESHGEMPMSRLAEMLDVSLSNATGLIDRIEERKLVERTRVPTDRRMVMVCLTPAGREMLDEIEVVREEILRRVLDQLDPPHLAGVASAMAALRDALDAVLTGPGSEGHVHSHSSPGRH